jgi:hypothetical protein
LTVTNAAGLWIIPSSHFSAVYEITFCAAELPSNPNLPAHRNSDPPIRELTGFIMTLKVAPPHTVSTRDDQLRFSIHAHYAYSFSFVVSPTWILDVGRMNICHDQGISL